MKTIGMLGGMSWESSAHYYRLANEIVRDELGGVHSARVVLDSVDFADIEALQAAGDWGAAAQILADRARSLEDAGAELLVLCTNTMHKVADRIEDAVSIPFVHIADATARAIHQAGLRRAGLLGTRFTMEQEFYRDRIETHGIEVVTPSAEDREVIHRVIYEELVRGVINDESREAYVTVIEHLHRAGAEGVILGCTEIELLIDATDSPIPVFPTTRIHVQAAVNLALHADR